MIIGIAAALLVTGGIVAFAMMRSGGNGTDTEEQVSPTPTPALQEAPETIDATLTINAAQTALTVEVTGLEGRYSGIEYELQYMTAKGPKGSLSGTKPIKLDEGKDTFTRNIELGTCSTGGKCTYDKDVSDFKLTLKLHTKDGSVQVLQKTYDEL